MNTAVQRIDLGFVNSYLLKAGDGYILIDCGTGMVWNRLESELLLADCLPEKLKLVILTHGDRDHVGNCSILQHKYGINIAIHEADLEMAKYGKSPHRHANTWSGKLVLIYDRFVPQPANGFEPNLLLQDSQRLDEYSLAAQIIHTPGHTRGSICVLTDQGDLFVGDTYSNHKRPRKASIVVDDEEMEESYAKIGYNNARIIYPGHGKPFSSEEISKLNKGN